MRYTIPLLLCLAALSCKKNVDYPPEIRPNDFWARYELLDENNLLRTYAYRGEDTVTFFSNFVIHLTYSSKSGIRDSVKWVNASLSHSLAGAPITIQINSPDPANASTMAEWSKSELETVLSPGKTFEFGDLPGQASLTIADYPQAAWSCSSTAASNQGGYFRVLEVTDYGSPQLGIPYFGKKATIEYAAPLFHDSGVTWTLSKGEAALFFKYNTF